MGHRKSIEGHSDQSPNILGKEAEDIAVDYLRHHGFRILERNYRGKDWEIDIIAKDKKTLVFVEVKMRKNADFGEPENFVDKYKRFRIIKGAKDYLTKKRLWDKMDVRFDVISIKNRKEVIHYKNAFRKEF